MTKTTIISEYTTWLNVYLEKAEKPGEQQGMPHKLSASILINQLKGLKSLDDLSETLSKVAFPPHSDIAQPHLKDSFEIKFHATRNTVKQLNEAARKAREICIFLEKISTKNDQTQQLIELLKKMLSDSKTFLYPDIIGILKHLPNYEMAQKMITHLESLPQKDRSLDPQVGSFDAMKHVDKMHEACLDLLRNNSDVCHGPESCDESVCANHLLQRVALLYQISYTPMIISEAISPPNDESSFWPCAIL